MKKKFILLLVFNFSLLIAPVFAEYSKLNIPDSADIRQQLVEPWFEASYEEITFKHPEFLSNDGGQKFKVFLEEDDSSYHVFVAAGKLMNVNVLSGEGFTKAEQYVYPGNLPGTWVLIKDKKTNKPIRIRYFFASDSDVYVQFSPNGKTALADLVIFGNYAAKGVSTGVPFSTFYTASIDDVIKLTQRSLPWKYVLINPALYNGVISMSSKIQSSLSNIVYAEDAIYNEKGELVQLTDGKEFAAGADSDENGKLYLSSQGFVKWIADGIVYPLSGSYLKREPLVEYTTDFKDIGYQGVLSQKYSLYLSLDWVRNLASAVVSVYTGREYRYFNSGVDVTLNPFAASVLTYDDGDPRRGISNTVTFIKDTGYNTKVLKSLLYLLAATEPDTFYFGAIREIDTSIEPEMKVFNKCVAFLPYFNQNKEFECSVFIDGRMITLEDFCFIYKNDFVYLTKVRSSFNFNPY